MVIGNTTYVVCAHFDETSNERLVDKIKRLIGEKEVVNWRTGISVI